MECACYFDSPPIIVRMRSVMILWFGVDFGGSEDGSGGGDVTD